VLIYLKTFSFKTQVSLAPHGDCESNSIHRCDEITIYSD